MKRKRYSSNLRLWLLPLALSALSAGCAVRITSVNLPSQLSVTTAGSGSGSVTTPAASPSPAAAPGNTAPTVSASTSYYVSNSGSSITVTLNGGSGPAFTATDPDAGDSVTLSSVTGTRYGTVTRNASSFTYTPTVGATGQESLTLVVTDSQGAQGTGTIRINVMSTKTWTGATSNTWDSTTGANWCGTVKADFTGCNGGSVPGASDVAVIDDTCTGANCSPTTNYNVSVAGLTVGGSTLTIGATKTLTVGSSGLLQSAGTFNGADGAIAVNGAVAISGGTFKSTSGTLTVNGNWTVSGSPAFNPNNGLLLFQMPWAQDRTITPGTVTYKNVQLIGNEQNNVVSGTMTVAGNFSASSGWSWTSINTGTISVSGNITNSGSWGVIGTGTIVAAGSGTITGAATSGFPNLTINTSGTYSLSGTVNLYGSYTYTSGTLNTAGASLVMAAPCATSRTFTPGTFTYSNVTFAGCAATFDLGGATLNVQNLTMADSGGLNTGSVNNGVLKVYGNLTVSGIGMIGSAPIQMVGTGTITGSSGAPIMNLVINTSGTISLSGTTQINGNYTWQSGSISAGTSTLKFFAGTGLTQNLTFGPSGYATLEFSGHAGNQDLGGATVSVQNLVLSDTHASSGGVNNGTFQIAGNLTTTSYGKYGTAALQMTGGSAATITQAAGGVIPASLVLAKTAGTTVSLGAALTLNQSGQVLTLTSGSLNMAGYALNLTGTLSLNGNTLTKGGGVLTVNGSAAGTGSLYGGTVNP